MFDAGKSTKEIALQSTKCQTQGVYPPESHVPSLTMDVFDLEQPLQLQASFKPTDGRERTISRFLKSSSIASQERCPDTS